MSIYTPKFDLGKGVVASCIYAGYPHRTCARGLEVLLFSKLRDFLKKYLAFCGYDEEGIYFRIDAYLNPEIAPSSYLNILEINAHFVDGWGTALNLSRAAGFPVERARTVKFPAYWACRDLAYLPELELAVQELNYLGHYAEVVFPPYTGFHDRELYVYGRPDHHPLIRPAHGRALDNKMNLARFSRALSPSKYPWEQGVVIPRFYFQETTPWEELPENVVFKFCDKTGPEATRARSSVLFRDQVGKGKFVRRCYAEQTVVAQEFVASAEERISPPVNGEDEFWDSAKQVVILTAGATPITGYLQLAPRGKRIINDNSIHAPILIDDFSYRGSSFGGHD